MGNPIEHSLSPEIFRFISEQLDHPTTYQKLQVLPLRLKQTVNLIKEYSFLNGWNVTIPHKESSAKLLNFLSPDAQAIGAVNVVQLKDGQLYGWNTDVDGIRETLAEKQFQVAGSHCMIFGAGGAARAVCYALGEAGASTVAIQNRDFLRAKKLASRFSRIFPKTEFQAIVSISKSKPDKLVKRDKAKKREIENKIDLCVNATPLGMVGFPLGNLARTLSSFSHQTLVFDLIYRPEQTPFLAKAAQLGLKTVGGLDMLCWQAISSWEIWVSPVSNRSELKSRLKKHLQENYL